MSSHDDGSYGELEPIHFPLVTCPSCGRDNPEGFQFCGYCGASLALLGASLEERKVVTVLFCDLVGFTARSDRADPEDVKATLRPFHARLKREIEAFGGTLDKFIGDAALGVFGSPVAHEDDPERAVRAALAIQNAMVELNEADPSLELSVRQGVDTGEAVVAHGAGPQIGESVTGDVVNTASRLQSVAPAGGIVVGEATYRATRHVIVYESLEPVSVKGKAEPLNVWSAIDVRGRLGVDVAPTELTPLVGREAEVVLLQKLFAEASPGRSARLVTVVGEPGVGKSRLVAELAAYLETLPDLVTWRQGRCLSYGEGVTFWALGEIVKAQAGILESDPPDEAWGKLEASLSEEGPDREWLKQRLAPLLGVEAGFVADRAESFAAWRAYLESIASRGPAVFVFEDLHWADPAMLDFIEHMAGSSVGFPILLICTTRPELFERDPGWLDGVDRVTRLTLVPLSDEETGRLISVLLDRGVLPPAVLALLLERAGGNPLYAEEFVRMMKDQGLLVLSGGTWDVVEDASVRFPGSIQALIAARLDMLPPDHKAVLQDASVIGKVFWRGAVAHVGGREDESVTQALADLSRKELIRPSPISSVQGEAEFAFWHALVRDVCYQQIPRASRAGKHRAAAEWAESMAGDRVEDVAEVLAHHYATAMDLARASGEKDAVTDLASSTFRFLVLAGDRALALDVGRAEHHFARALELAPPEHELHPDVLAKWAEAARQAGRLPEAATVLEEAIDAFRARGDPLAAARAMITLSSVLQGTGSARQEEVASAAVHALGSEPPGPDLVAAYARMAGVKLVLGDPEATAAWAERAIALASELGVEVPARTLGFRGYARSSMGDREGLDDMRTALRLATDRGEGRDAAVLYNNLAVALLPVEGPVGVLAVLREGIAFSERRGITELAVAMSVATLDQLYDVGDWDEALRSAESMAHAAEEAGDIADLLQARWMLTRLFGSRGAVAAAIELARWLVPAARESGGVEDLIAGLTSAALAYAAGGQHEEAVELVSELVDVPHVHRAPTYPAFLGEMIRITCAAGKLDLAARLVAGVESEFPYHEHALCAARASLLEGRGEHAAADARFEEAARRWEIFGVLPERAHALFGRGRCLMALERPDQAAALLREAARIFARLGAEPALGKANRLLERATSVAS